MDTRPESFKRPTRAAGAVAFLACLLVLLLADGALAHVPMFTPGGLSPSAAPLIADKEKSYVLYGSLDTPDQIRYFRLDLKAGDRIWLQTLSVRDEGFTPSLALLGPDIPGGAPAPARLQAPSGTEALIRIGERREAEYEPFTPGAYHFSARLDLRTSTDGTYHIAVFSEGGAGPFGLAVGYKEEFSVADWLGMPASLVKVYHWEGKSWPLVFAPLLLVLIVGTAGMLIRRAAYDGPFSWLISFAGLFSLGSAAAVLVQMAQAAPATGLVPAMGITAAFIVLPALSGILSLRLGLRSRRAAEVGERIAALAFAALSAGLFAGFFVGPLLALVAALGPPYPRRMHRA